MDDIELPELPESEREIRKDKLNTLVAITVTLLVTFMAICKIVDNNLVLEMQKVQAEKVDNWSWFQSLHIREDINDSKLADLASYLEEDTTELKKKATQEDINKHKELAKRITEKKDKIKETAQQNDERYEQLNQRHEKFDLAEAAVSIAVSLLALTSLLQKRFMYYAALLPALIGIIKGVLGLLS